MMSRIKQPSVPIEHSRRAIGSVGPGEFRDSSGYLATKCSLDAYRHPATACATAARISSWSATRGDRSSASAGARAGSGPTRAIRGRRSLAAGGMSPLSRRHRVGLAQLRDIGGLVGLPRLAAEHEDADALIARPDLAGNARPDPGDVVGVEREALLLDLDLTATTEGHVDLLLTVLLVVVHWVIVVVGWHVDDLHAERFDPELGPGPLEGALEDGLHLIDPLHRVGAHCSSSRIGGRARAGYRHLLALWTSKQVPAASPPASVALWTTLRAA